MKRKSRIFLLSLSLILAFSAFCSAADMRADMNGDGAVDTDDAIYLLRHVLMPNSYPLKFSCTEHKEEILPAVAATCTENGLTEGKKCSVCGEITVVQTQTAPLGHKEKALPALDATCLEYGLTEGSACERCGLELRNQCKIAPNGHDYNSSVCLTCGENIVFTPNRYFYFELLDDGTYSIEYSINLPQLPKNVVIPPTYNGKPVTRIGSQAIFQEDAMETCMLPNTITTLEYGVFRCCDNIKTVTIPKSLKTMGANIFSQCPKLDAVTLPASLTSIGTNMFIYCPELESVYIPKSVKTIKTGSYVTLIGDCPSFTEVIVDEDNSYFCSIDGNLYNKSGTKLIYYAVGKKEETFVIPSTVKTLGNYCFAGANNLKAMTVPNTVETFKGYEFYKCDGLETVIIEDGIIKLTNGLFYQCKALKRVVIPESVTYIDNVCFRDCESLCEAELHSTLTYVGYAAFRYNKFTSLTLPGSVKTVEYAAFAVSHSLRTVTLGEGITKIDEDAFYYCDALTEIYIPSTVTYIGENAFQNCTKLQKISFNGTKAEWLAIEKDPKWNRSTGSYKIYCTDGTILK